jgi:protoheme ferro-lyase
MKMAAPTHRILFSSHAVPQRLDPLSTQYPKHHHERMEEVIEIPPTKQN